MADAPVTPVVTPPVAGAPAASETPKPALTTELGGEKPAEPAKAEEPKLGADGKPIEPKAEEKKSDAPIAFDPAKLTLPEGMKTDDPLFKSYTEIMGDDKLSPQDRAQKSLDLYTNAIKQAGEASTQAWTKVNEGWVKEVKADPEIGGAKFDTTKTEISRTIDLLGDKAPAFRQALDITGIGNHPAFWKGMAAFAKLLTEGGHVAGKPSGSGGADVKPADFFPNSKMS